MQASMPYPNINVDFRKLDRDALLRLVNYFDLKVSPQISDEDLAITIAGVFEAKQSSEHEVVDKFAAKFCYTQSNNSCFPPQDEDGADALSLSPTKRAKSTIEYHHFHPASVGEQVSAKATKNGEETEGWILGNVLSYDISRETYEIQDEDDPKRIMKLSFQQVRRLEDSAVDIYRGDRVMGVFPETTCFYRATVVKSPKELTGEEDGGEQQWEVVVRFDDDEDDKGRWPARRVPARFILRANTFATFFETEPALEK